MSHHHSLLLAALLAAGCAAPTGNTLPTILLDATPLTSRGACITVLGLGCPNCASNVDLKLKQVAGVAAVHVDLGQGLVDVEFGGGVVPSRRDLAVAVRDSGFTVVSIAERP